MSQTRKGHGEKQTRKQSIFIANLLAEPTVKEAAQKSGIGEATAYRWMKDPAFQESYREARWCLWQNRNTTNGKLKIQQ